MLIDKQIMCDLIIVNYIDNDRVLMWELGVGAYLFICGIYDIFFGKNQYFIFLFLQAIAFCIVGFGFVGTHVSSF